MSAAAVAAVVAAAVGAAAAAAAPAPAHEEKQEYDYNPEAAAVVVSAEHIITLSPRCVIDPDPLRAGRRAPSLMYAAVLPPSEPYYAPSGLHVTLGEPVNGKG